MGTAKKNYTIPSRYDLAACSHFVQHKMPDLYQHLLNNKYDINWDQTHNLRKYAQGLSRKTLYEYINIAKYKETPFRYLCWLVINRPKSSKHF